jgi:integrase
VAGKGRRAFGSVRQLASGRWQARYLDTAGVRHTAPRTFPSKVDATRYLAQVEADLLRGRGADPKLHELADAVPARYRALTLLAGYGGLRWAELVGLRRHHVDLAGARVQVVEQAAEVPGKIIVSPPKPEAGRRVVTLPRIVVEALAEHLEEYAEPGPDGLVSTTPKGGYLLRSPFNRFVWRPAVQQGRPGRAAGA